MSLIIEGGYIQKGLSMTLNVTTPEQPEGTGEFITLRPRIDYLSIAVLGKGRIDLSKVSPYAAAGPRVDFVLNKNPDGFQAVIDKFKNFDIGVTMGVGIEINAMPVQLLTEFRFSPNITNSYSSESLNVRSHSLEFLLGVRMNR